VGIRLKVDKKGRVGLPAKIRKDLGIGGTVALELDGKAIRLMPIKDPIDAITSCVVAGTTDIVEEIRDLRRAALEEARKASDGRRRMVEAD
jgi:AbrB family looped-hinge helix DNA binding protein